MTAPPLGLGLIGCGMIGQIHADGLAKLVDEGEIRAVAAADLSRECLAAAHHNCAFEHLTTDAREVIDHPEVEAVLLTTPTSAHRDLALAVLAAGKHLLCEKPLAPTFDVARELCDAVAASPVVARVDFPYRFHPLVNRLRALVESGELGRPMGYMLRDDQYFPAGDFVPGHSTWRSSRAVAGGGALIEHSIHAADILSWCFGPARRVFALTRNVFGYDVEDTGALSIEHDSGVVGTLISVFNGVLGREEKRLEVFFEQGTVEVTTDFLVGAEEDSFLVQRPGEPAQRSSLGELADARDEYFASLGITRRDFVFYLYPLDRAFVQMARAAASVSAAAGRAATTPPPGSPSASLTPPTAQDAPGFADALAAHALVEAAYRSAASGRAVDLVGDLDVG